MPYREMPKTDRLPQALYRAEQVQQFDRLAIEQFGLPAALLMRRAAESAFAAVQSRYADSRSAVVFCGPGNNGGDGYVFAAIAARAGWHVTVIAVGDVPRDEVAQDALKQWLELGHINQLPCDIPTTDIVVDALLGVGLQRDVSGEFAKAVEIMNRASGEVISMDVPSGLCSDTGRCLGSVVKADLTCCFVGLKQGLFTGSGPEYVGDVIYDALSIPAPVFASSILSSRRLDAAALEHVFTSRSRVSHKGDMGHVLLIGGAHGMSGAIVLAAAGALRTGAGLVSVASCAESVAALNASHPEVMAHAIDAVDDLMSLIERADVVVIGPGLGQSDWSQLMFKAVMHSDKPMVVDADALNLLSEDVGVINRPCVITPHPGEAARLLGMSSAEINADRFASALKLHQVTSATVVLKGAGTVVQGVQQKPPAVIDAGNPGMASGGMGDVLSGVIAALIAQGFDADDAAQYGALVHSVAADRAAEQGERGMSASDVIDQIRAVVNL
jgi:hydroxyethylthiazole kinase-like uncharacterized protein yjeF